MRCLVQNCDHNSTQTSKSQNITFQLLPTEPSKRAAWLKSLYKVKGKTSAISAGVCSCHFLPGDLYVSHGRCKLRPGAVSFLEQNGHKVFDCLIKPCQVNVTRLECSSQPQCVGTSSNRRDVKVCRVCLATDCKLYSMSAYKSLQHAYETLTGLSIAKEKHKLPPYVCTECAQRLINCVQFRSRCVRTRKALVDIAKKNDYITLKSIKSVNRSVLKSNLGVTHNQPVCYNVDDGHVEHERTQTHTPADGEELDDVKTESGVFECDHLSDAANDGRITLEVSSCSYVKAENHDASNVNCLGDGAEGDLDSASGGGGGVWCKPVGESTSDKLWNDRGTNRRSARAKKMTNVAKSFIASTRRGRKRKSPADHSLDTNSDACREDRHKITKTKRRMKSIVKKGEEIKGKKDGAKDSCVEETNDLDEFRLLEEKQKKLALRLRDNLDRSIFTVTNLTLEEQVREVEARQHQASYTAARYRCSMCYRGFNVEHCYEAHLVKHHELSGQHVCVVCRVRHLTAKALRKHMTASHTRRYSCNICPFVSRHRGAATQHQNFHAGIIYQCPQCPMFSNNYTTYQNHLRIKHASQFVCALCGYTFANEKGLHMHKKVKHRIVDALVIDGPYCETCDVKFISEVAHDRHLKLSSKHCSDGDPARISNDPQKMWTDEQRSRIMQQSRRISIRKRSPSELVSNGPVVCEQCGEELMNLRAYAHHFRYMHPGKNRTQFSPQESHCMCELCGHVFRCNALLMGHMWMSHGVGEWRPRPAQPVKRQRKAAEHPSYECPICGKLFTVKYNFQRHLFNHTGQRPHRCEECTRSFKSRGEKRSHVEHVHFKKPWPKRVRSRKQRASRALVSSDVENNEEVSVFSDRDLGFGENHEGASVFSDEEQDFREENNEGALVISDEELGFGEDTEDASTLSVEVLKENDETCVTDSVWEDQHIWYE